MFPIVASNHQLDALVSVRGARADGADIERAIRRHCRDLGASQSTTTGAINFALKEHGSTLQAIRAGNRRADQLHHRAHLGAPPTPA